MSTKPLSFVISKVGISVIVLLTLASGCIPATKFKGSEHCSAYLRHTDKVLLYALPYTNWEYQLSNIRKTFADRKVEVLYAPEEEFNLLAIGIVNPLDTTNFARLQKKGITHIMIIRELRRNEGSAIAYKTPFELSHEWSPFASTPTRDEATSSVEILTYLLKLETRQYYSFSATTHMSGVEFRDNGGGSTNVNGGGLFKARNAAIRKSVQRVAQKCL